MTTFTNWQVNQDSNETVWLGLDRNEATVNTINDVVLDELQAIINQLNPKDTKAVVIYSEKDKGFVAGADIAHFSKFTEEAQISEFLKKGQSVLDSLEALSIPTIAMIDGFCMGGGLELALACDYRIATNDTSTRLGLPEILLGFHPGWGGTVRLPKLIGGFDAITKVILTGRTFSAKAAKKVGFVDEVVALRQLRKAATHFALNKPAKHKPTFLQSITNQAIVRKALSKLIFKNLSKKVNVKHYPAFKAVVDNWVKDGGLTSKSLKIEEDSITGLISQNETAKNLIRAYFLREEMKAFSKQSSFISEHVHVVGAGTMGGDIAAWCVLKGLNVTLQDRNIESIAPAIARAHKLFKKKLKKPRLVRAAMDRLIPDVNGFGIKKADVIIEAIFENLEAKQALFKSLEQQAKSTAILATNTSSIPLDEINNAMKDAKRLVGIHFFNPVAKMELVEIVSGEQSDKQCLENACAFVGQIGRLSLPVKSSAGFLVNRILMPYLMECVALLEEGFSGEAIDSAAKNFGMMMGPVELADTVGLDVCLAVAENLTSHFGGKVPQRLRDYVKKGDLGKKTGKGFYEYDKKGKPVKKAVEGSDHSTIANRLILRMVNEAAACLREGVVGSDDLLDAGMIFGTGFAPFRGGPMQYAHSFGEGKLNALFEQLEGEFGSRFKADEGL